MSATQEIIERIKKLLRLARSANPHEAQLALQRALALAAEHRVEINGLNPDEAAKEKEITHRDTEPYVRLSYDKCYAVRVLQAFFRITAVYGYCVVVIDGWPRTRQTVHLIGTRSDVEIALYVYAFLLQHFSRCWRKHSGRFRNRRAFIDGMFHGIIRALLDQQPEPGEREVRGDELVLTDQKAYVSRVFGQTSESKYGKPDHNATAARSAGWAEGVNTNIRTPLKGGAEVLALK